MKGIALLRIIIGLVLAAVVSVAVADDMVAPPWRGVAGSTHQDWRFDAGANPATPEVWSNPFGSPSAQIAVGLASAGWLSQLPGLGTKTGYWDLGGGGTITLTIPNQAAENLCKYVWLQVTCFKDISQPPTVGVAEATKLREQELVAEAVETGGDWLVKHSVWRLPQGPLFDTATITASVQWGSVVDQVIVDTVEAPTFGSVVLAKTQPDETFLELTGPVVTRKFGSFFYLEDANRVTGIRVNCPASQVPAEGTSPWVLGTIRTIDGERVIDQASVAAGPVAAIPGALGMNGRSTGVGLVPRGLLIRVWGRASVPGPAPNTFLLQDGSPNPVLVELHGVQPPTDGSYVSLTGVLGSNSTGMVLRANSSSPINTWP